MGLPNPKDIEVTVAPIEDPFGRPAIRISRTVAIPPNGEIDRAVERLVFEPAEAEAFARDLLRIARGCRPILPPLAAPPIAAPACARDGCGE